MDVQAIDFILIKQKDRIFDMIHEGKYEETLALLDFLRPLWQECSYLYKWHECKRAVAEAIREKLTSATHWKQEQKWRDMLQKAM